MGLGVLAGRDVETVEEIRRLSSFFLDRAESADRNGPLNDTLRENIEQIIATGFIGANISREYGGVDLSADAHRECTKTISAACGVTAFTQQQLHAGGNFIGRCDHENLRQELLPQFARGENICGVGFSHLRRPGPPTVTAVRTSDGFTIDGVLPWISAWSILDSFILGATVNDGSMIYCYLPIDEFQRHLTASEPMQLSTMSSSETVKLMIEGLKMPTDYVLSEHDSTHMVTYDYRGISGHTELPLGCALGSAGYLRTLGEKRGHAHIVRAANRIEQKASEIEEAALSWDGSRWEEPAYYQNAMKARTDAILLAVEAATASVAATGGSAHLTSNPAQRRFRESAFYATQAQTLSIQEALLEVLIDG